MMICRKRLQGIAQATQQGENLLEQKKGQLVGLGEIIVLGIALSMDAFAVTISNMFAYRGISRTRALWMPLAFGAFQGIMPLTGFLLGSLVSEFISKIAGPLTFVILGFIGGKMIVDAIREMRGQTARESSGQTFTLPILLVQALATSIDALAVGVSFAAQGVDAYTASAIIALTTGLCCVVALIIGRRFGNALGERATIIGGIVLVLIGLKALL